MLQTLLNPSGSWKRRLSSPWSRVVVCRQILYPDLIFSLAVRRVSALQWTKPWCFSCYWTWWKCSAWPCRSSPLLNSVPESLRTEKFYPPHFRVCGFLHPLTWNNPTQEFLKAVRIYIAMEKYSSYLFLSLIQCEGGKE